MLQAGLWGFTLAVPTCRIVPSSLEGVAESFGAFEAAKNLSGRSGR